MVPHDGSIRCLIGTWQYAIDMVSRALRIDRPTVSRPLKVLSRSIFFFLSSSFALHGRVCLQYHVGRRSFGLVMTYHNTRQTLCTFVHTRACVRKRVYAHAYTGPKPTSPTALKSPKSSLAATKSPKSPSSQRQTPGSDAGRKVSLSKDGSISARTEAGISVFSRAYIHTQPRAEQCVTKRGFQNGRCWNSGRNRH